MRDSDTRDAPVILSATLRSDGGSRGNPGPSGIGYTLLSRGPDGGEAQVSAGGWYIGRATNNQAEYHALVWGLENALARNVRMLSVELDSELVARQLNGQYKVRSAQIRPLFELARRYLAGFHSVSVSHIPRGLNSESDRLANAAMDARGPVGDYDVEYIDPDYMDEAMAGLASFIQGGPAGGDALARPEANGGC